MAQRIRFRLDGTIYNGIGNPDDFGVTIGEDTTLNFRYTSFDNDMEFITDAYSYLNTLISDSCGCGLVDVTVEYLCGGVNWKRLCTGYLILSECITDLDKCKIRTKVYDNTFSTLINNNKSIPFSVRSSVTKNLIPISVLPNWYAVDMFVPATGEYNGIDFVYAVRVEDAFKHIVKCMTDDRVDCIVPPFASGEFVDLMIMNGNSITAPQSKVETVISFQDLYVAISSKRRLGMKATLQDNGRPLLTIDYADVLNSQAATIDMVNVKGVTKKVDTSMLFASVNFGNDNILEQWECNGGDTACTFTQTPFRGFRNETFGLLGDCNSDTKLNLLTTQVIFDTNIIEDIYVWGNLGYQNDAIIVSCEATVIPAIKKAKQGDPYNIGQTVYNAEFTNEEVAAAWIGGIPNTLAYYNQEFLEEDVNFDYQADNTPELSYGIIFATPTSYVQDTGEFPVVGNPINANPNYLLGRTFRVPVAGIYTFAARLVIKGRIAGELPTYYVSTSIMHYNFNDELINQYYGTQQPAVTYFDPLSGDFITPNIFPSVYVSFVCNAGDLVRCNSTGFFTADTTTILTIANSALDEFDNEIPSMFTGTAVQLNETELQPYNPCDYKSNLYDFEKPLTMEQIQAMMDNASGSVRFSRTENINAGATGVISKASIPSVIRQKATFTIRSNENL